MAVADSHKPHLPDFVPASPFHTEEHEAFRNTVRGSLNSHTIGCPPIAALGPEWMKRKALPELLAGEKISALAITEPSKSLTLRRRMTPTPPHFVGRESRSRR